MSISYYRDTTRVIDSDGNESVTTKEKTSAIQRNDEPDYIKVYTRMWCEFNGIPLPYRDLFLELATRMSYCNAADLASSQIVYAGKPFSEAIMASLGWKQRMYSKGLAALCACGAIRRVGRGAYQVNPSFAGRGEWKYNPRLQRGGVEDLVATFRMSANGEKSVNTRIVWADDGDDTAFNQMYRTALGVKPSDKTVLKEQRASAQDQIPGQMSLADLGVV